MLPATRDLYERLRRSILRGDWPTGGRGPSLAELTTVHGLNRSQSSLVLEALAAEGLIVRVQGTAPTVVHRPTAAVSAQPPA